MIIVLRQEWIKLNIHLTGFEGILKVFEVVFIFLSKMKK